MKKNYNFNINPKPLSSEEIRQHQDFDALFAKFQEQEQKPEVAAPTPRRNNVRWLTVAGLAAAASLALVLMLRVGNTLPYEERNAAFFADRPFVEEPLLQVPKPILASYPIDAEEGGILEYESGSRLIIPAAAFHDTKGQPVQGEVAIHYREMHDFVDFFLSGIPMVYDSAGVSYNLESAGMIEIYAEQNGQRVRMAPGKSIDVELVSSLSTPHLNVPPNFNIYHLDTVGRKWVYQNIDRIQVLQDEAATLPGNHPALSAQQALMNSLDGIQAQEKALMEQLTLENPAPLEPLRPRRHNGTDFVFDLDLQGLDAAQNTYQGTFWQLSPNSSVTEQQLNQAWDNFHLTQINNRDYQLSLLNEQQTLTVIVNPVLSGADYDRALAEYEQEYAAYRQAMATWEAQIEALRTERSSDLQTQREGAYQKFQEAMKTLADNGASIDASTPLFNRKIVNRFQADRLGIWNCDRPLAPHMIQMKAKLVDERGQAIKNQTVFLVDRGRNTIQEFVAGEDMEIRFDLHATNMMWLVTEDQKIAIYRSEDFKQLKADEQNYTFVMEKVNRPLQNEQDVRDVLQF
ncbi:MAG: hypothetical protein AAGH79_05060 [Bacteroidota bacterium]